MADTFSAHRSQEADSSELDSQRQKIENIEHLFEALMPGTFIVKTLMGFGDIISKAIIAILNSNNQLGLNEGIVLEDLRQARKYIQLAIDEFAKAKNNEKRYEYLGLARKELRAALNAW